jgi:glycosyltransferase involved in cell wall biosynthesis
VKSKPRVLFVCHSGSRNGATFLMLHLLRWLKQEGSLDFEVLINGRGDLLDDFKSVCRTTVWRGPSVIGALLPSRWHSSLKPKLEAQSLKAILGTRQFDLVYVNTVAPWQFVPNLARRCRGLIWHIHELEYAIRLLMGDGGWQKTFPLARRFISVSESVSQTLNVTFGVPREKIDLVNGFIENAAPLDGSREAIRQRIRQEAGWPLDAFVVGACGTLGWRKGSDVFLQLARFMREQGDGKARFLWVGGGSRADEIQFAYDLKSMNLQDSCRWIPETPRVAEYYAAMDVFALTSREDPFPLVMLEAGRAGVPLVCFEGSGGGPEFAGKGAGLAASYMDLAGFGRHVTALQADASLRKRLGEEAARQVQSGHTVEKQAPKMLHCIERCLP